MLIKRRRKAKERRMGKTIRRNDDQSFAHKRAAAIREYRQLCRNLRGRGETILEEHAKVWTDRAHQLKREYAL